MKRTSLLIIIGMTSWLVSMSAQALTSDAEQPINIHAKNVDANQKTGVSLYRGNVVLTQGSMRLEADRLEVRQREGRADVIRAWGNPVRMKSQSDAGQELNAQAARAEYYANERRLDLYERAIIQRNQDTVTGAVVHYAMDAQTFSAEGGDGKQVTAVIQPAPAKQP
ncbi:MAG: lipopolysaccharide transport periplasmic protein LptA [Gammaproteobacteria bacterium]|nr:lipopolysaccharide transport periplasmic protein LptA [Gammaproteobacteria bacterium]